MNAFASFNKRRNFFIINIYKNFSHYSIRRCDIIHFWFSKNGKDKTAGTLKARKNLHLNDLFLSRRLICRYVRIYERIVFLGTWWRISVLTISKWRG